jgi:hypothetical protein
MHSVEIASDK